MEDFPEAKKSSNCLHNVIKFLLSSDVIPLVTVFKLTLSGNPLWVLYIAYSERSA
jgi:hypothetical protein